MTRMPDGWVVFVEADKLEVRIKEARELVLCKNCKHYRFADRWREWECELTGYDMGENWYCADGERKEDDDG